MGGAQEISAGRVILWYIRSLGPDYPESNDLFPLMESFTDKRVVYQRWLQDMFQAALPLGSAIPPLIRPHSPRAGWATDRARQETPTHTLLAEGNWGSVRAMSTYIRTNVRDLSASADFRLIPPSIRINNNPPTQRRR